MKVKVFSIMILAFLEVILVVVSIVNWGFLDGFLRITVLFMLGGTAMAIYILTLEILSDKKRD